MAFMVPEYFTASSSSPMYHVEADWDSFVSPELFLSEVSWAEELSVRRVTCGVYHRLSAPGYMDCTDWVGPFPDMERARFDLSESYGVDPDTGDGLEVVGLDEGDSLLTQ